MVGPRDTAPAFALVGIIAFSLSHCVFADSQIVYQQDVKPILEARCYACHGALKQEAGLRLDTGHLIRKGTQAGEVIIPGQSGASVLIERISAADPSLRMPPEGEPLSESQITVLRQWIDQGATSPEDERPEADPESHWAFQPPVRPPVPPFGDLSSTNPIDAFLRAKLSGSDVAAVARADKHVLLRRVTLDLIGLPPSRAELLAFLKDDSTDAYARVVDRLLHDPRHGERWARHWMDVWRYSDWYGRRHVPDVWNSASQIWRWRDWIVRSLNTDRGYDRMVHQMLAADEICPEDYEARAATGYLVRNWYALNPNDWMRNNVEHTARGFLGLTFQCAHCHDHKYDPISQDDYFRMRAFFEPIYVRQDQVPGEADPGPFQDYEYSSLREIQRLGMVSVFDKSADAVTWFYTGGDERNRVEERGSIPPGVPSFLSETFPGIVPVTLPADAWYPALRDDILETMQTEADAAVATARQQIGEASSDATPSEEALARLATAEQELTIAVETARASGTPGALEGQQSLFFDASSGRRIVNNSLSRLTELEDGTTITFQFQMLTPAHVNFQLAKDAGNGLTAAYVAFDSGRIISYRPGTFTEFDAGAFDAAAEQRRFDVRLILQTKLDQGLLTVRSHVDGELLVDGVPVALNGWNPVGDPTKAITFDARTGSRAVVDDIRILAPTSNGSYSDDGPLLVVFDFEPPKHAEGTDVVGSDGWSASPFCSESATSLVRSAAISPEIQQAEARRTKARRAVRLATLPGLHAEASLAAALAEHDSLNARIDADRARLTEPDSDKVARLAEAASRQEREAILRRAEADQFAKELALAEAEARPGQDNDRQQAVDAALTEFAAAQEAVRKSQKAFDESSPLNSYTPLGPEFPRTSTGRRAALARWITDRSNPLTARVAVNHIWMRHFHAPLVATVDNFGRSGAAPTHPELLDWLAVEFMGSGWSMKHLHRLIVTSDAYQRRSGFSDVSSPSSAADPDNKLLRRMNTGRMEAEVMRDSLLALGGLLDESMGGQELENSESLATHRRSLYYATYPEQGGKSPFGELFDGPDALGCYRRTRSIVPQQALVLTNSGLVHDISRRLQQRIRDEITAAEGNVPDFAVRFIHAGFEYVLARPPTESEIQACRRFVDGASVSGEAGDADTAVWESLIRALLNHNDFVTIR